MCILNLVIQRFTFELLISKTTVFATAYSRTAYHIPIIFDLITSDSINLYNAIINKIE